MHGGNAMHFFMKASSLKFIYIKDVTNKDEPEKKRKEKKQWFNIRTQRNRTEKATKQNKRRRQVGHQQLTRFEFGGTGMFHILNLLEDCDLENKDAEELERIEYIFEKDLPHPDINWSKDMHCWFTSEGVTRFRDELEAFAYLVYLYLEGAGFGTFDIRKGKPDGDIVYRDEYQVVVKSIK